MSFDDISGGALLKVLVAEDNVVNQVVTRAMLDQLGVEVVMASDGEEALSCACTESFDLILMDMHMPGMNGLEATRALRVSERTQGRVPVPIVAMTGGDERQDGPACREAGMDGFLAKPFSLQALQECLRRFTHGQ
jgi:two-component system, sensor histidine kinase